MMDQGPERDHTPDEAGGLFHFAPGDQPLCGDDCVARVYIDDPAAVAGCADCLELVAEDLQDENDYRGHCLHCRREITARGGDSSPIRRPDNGDNDMGPATRIDLFHALL